MVPPFLTSLGSEWPLEIERALATRAPTILGQVFIAPWLPERFSS